MNKKMEIYKANESEGNKNWIWSKAVSVGKKVLAAGVVMTLAPLLLPPLVVASTIAFISSVPYCLFLANYACIQKLMSSLLPNTEKEKMNGTETDESAFEDSKLGHGASTTRFDGNEPWMATDEPILIPIEEDEETTKESTSLIEKIRDKGRTDSRTSEEEAQDGEKSGNAKSEKVQDQAGKHEVPGTRPEGESGGTTTEAFTGKDEEPSLNEPINQAVNAPHGTGEEKRKNTSKKKKKTGRAGVQ